jgi:hypothetical protein
MQSVAPQVYLYLLMATEGVKTMLLARSHGSFYQSPVTIPRFNSFSSHIQDEVRALPPAGALGDTRRPDS